MPRRLTVQSRLPLVDTSEQGLFFPIDGARIV
jgi:hypothetical protein